MPPLPDLGAPSVAFAVAESARLPLDPPFGGGILTTLAQASLHAADWSVAPPRFDADLSADAGGLATEDPGVSSDRTPTGWSPPACRPLRHDDLLVTVRPAGWAHSATNAISRHGPVRVAPSQSSPLPCTTRAAAAWGEGRQGRHRHPSPGQLLVGSSAVTPRRRGVRPSTARPPVGPAVSPGRPVSRSRSSTRSRAATDGRSSACGR